MFDFKPDQNLGKPELYRQLLAAGEALISGEPDPIANMANIAALMAEFLPDINWAGFYRVIGNELVLGPFIGRPACIRIPIGSGVCGAAVEGVKTLCVADVHSFPGHIACDAATKSELVVPIVSGGKVVAVIDLDSPEAGRFDEHDVEGIEQLAGILAPSLSR